MIFFGVILSFLVHAKLSCLAPVTPNKVKTLIQSAPMKTSPMDILLTSLKICCDELSIMITHIANASFQVTQFPASLKVGQVTPLLKMLGHDTSDYKNFRPITNLTTILKII